MLCSNDELMNAVWGDEPMHTHTELARLVWELRRELEPLGATEVVVNERRRGYRLVTCAEAASERIATDPDADSDSGPMSGTTEPESSSTMDRRRAHGARRRGSRGRCA